MFGKHLGELVGECLVHVRIDDRLIPRGQYFERCRVNAFCVGAPFLLRLGMAGHRFRRHLMRATVDEHLEQKGPKGPKDAVAASS